MFTINLNAYRRTPNVCRRLQHFALVACVLLGLNLSTAHAQTTFTITECDSVPMQTTDWDEAFQIPYFDPNVGDLLSVVVSERISIDTETQVENLSPSPAVDMRLNIGAWIELTLPNGALFNTFAGISDRADYAAYDGTTDGSGTSGKTISGTAQELESGNYVDDFGGTVDDFIGIGLLSLDGSALGFFSVSGGTGNVYNSAVTQANTVVCVEYEYEARLPVELVSFNVDSKEDRSLQLNWTTLSESDNIGFQVQYAWENDPFQDAGFVEGSGSTNLEQHYNYRLDDLSPGTYRVRLKQLDVGGGFAYSPTLEAYVDIPGRYLLEAAYPNPFNPQTTVRFSVRDAVPVELGLYDLSGRLVEMLYSDIPEAGNVQELRIDGSTLTSGTYMVVMKGKNIHTSQAVTLVK